MLPPERDAPDLVTCFVYILVALFFLGTTIAILSKAFGAW